MRISINDKLIYISKFFLKQIAQICSYFKFEEKTSFLSSIKIFSLRQKRLMETCQFTTVVIGVRIIDVFFSIYNSHLVSIISTLRNYH